MEEKCCQCGECQKSTSGKGCGIMRFNINKIMYNTSKNEIIICISKNIVGKNTWTPIQIIIPSERLNEIYQAFQEDIIKAVKA